MSRPLPVPVTVTVTGLCNLRRRYDAESCTIGEGGR